MIKRVFGLGIIFAIWSTCSVVIAGKIEDYYEYVKQRACPRNPPKLIDPKLKDYCPNNNSNECYNEWSGDFYKVKEINEWFSECEKRQRRTDGGGEQLQQQPILSSGATSSGGGSSNDAAPASSPSPSSTPPITMWPSSTPTPAPPPITPAARQRYCLKNPSSSLSRTAKPVKSTKPASDRSSPHAANPPQGASTNPRNRPSNSSSGSPSDNHPRENPAKMPMSPPPSRQQSWPGAQPSARPAYPGRRIAARNAYEPPPPSRQQSGPGAPPSARPGYPGRIQREMPTSAHPRAMTTTITTTSRPGFTADAVVEDARRTAGTSRSDAKGEGQAREIARRAYRSGALGRTDP